jgi:hypothetical protein
MSVSAKGGRLILVAWLAAGRQATLEPEQRVLEAQYQVLAVPGGDIPVALQFEQYLPRHVG